MGSHSASYVEGERAVTALTFDSDADLRAAGETPNRCGRFLRRRNRLSVDLDDEIAFNEAEPPQIIGQSYDQRALLARQSALRANLRRERHELQTGERAYTLRT